MHEAEMGSGAAYICAAAPSRREGMLRSGPAQKQKPAPAHLRAAACWQAQMPNISVMLLLLNGRSANGSQTSKVCKLQLRRKCNAVFL